jgi:uncharacterized protein
MTKLYVTSLFIGMAFMQFACCAQKSGKTAKATPGNSNISYAANNNSLLWEITGNGLQKPSYIFGTIHLLCKDEAALSKELKMVIKDVDKIYFEINMENMMADALAIMFKMNMRDNKTLKDLLSDEDYNLVKDHFTKKSGMSLLPFTSIEKMKPLFTQTLLAQEQMDCDGSDGMEMKIMAENKLSEVKKPIDGLESASFQVSIFDSIPYKDQADELVKIIKSKDNNKKSASEDLGELTKLYKSQNLDSIVAMMQSDKDALTSKYADLMLYQRNKNWIPVIEKHIKAKTALFAVGAAHLGGTDGVIDLLRKKGYTIKPIKNNMNPSI